jgi:hypothetical protein
LTDAWHHGINTGSTVEAPRCPVDTPAVAGILALGLGAAVYPQLLAIVVVVLTRPDPKRLLWACYLGAISVSIGCSVAVLLVFRDRSTVAGSSSHRLGASVYLIVGAIIVLAAIVLATDRGRTALGANLRRIRPRAEARPDQAASAGGLKARAEAAISQGSLLIAAGVGAVLGIPGPFDVVALGRMTRAGYSLIGALVLILAFNLIKFLLIEVPIVSYAVDPDGTAGRVDRLSAWLRKHQVRAIAAVVGIIGLVLIGRGIGRLG